MIFAVVLASLLSCVYGHTHALGVRPLPDGRIVGGEDVAISEVPWQISMVYYGNHRCGGAIISADTIMTAAHCLDGVSATNLQVRAGSSQVTHGGQLVKVLSFVQHPNWNAYTLDYDYAVMKLVAPLTLGAGVQPIAVVKGATPIATGSPVLITGWGALKEAGSSPVQLQKVVVPAVGQAECSAAYGVGEITGRMFCAGLPEGGKDACQGDSGGPVVIAGQLAGVVSWGYGCARPAIPGVYSRLSHVRSWIDAQM